jgi:hypothetical protein
MACSIVMVRPCSTASANADLLSVALAVGVGMDGILVAVEEIKAGGAACIGAGAQAARIIDIAAKSNVIRYNLLNIISTSFNTR